VVRSYLRVKHVLERQEKEIFLNTFSSWEVMSCSVCRCITSVLLSCTMVDDADHAIHAPSNNLAGRSLVALDELGRGTATLDGAAIAGAVLEYMTQNVGCRCEPRCV
jgi:hypothetical protein